MRCTLPARRRRTIKFSISSKLLIVGFGQIRLIYGSLRSRCALQKRRDMLLSCRLAAAVLELLVYCQDECRRTFREGSALVSGVFDLLIDRRVSRPQVEHRQSVLTLAFFAMLKALSMAKLSPGKGRPAAACFANSSASIEISRICMTVDGLATRLGDWCARSVD